jgi:plasmid stability protein
MPKLTIHDIPQNEYDALAARGARHGRSAEEEARHLLHEAAAEELLVLELERATRAVEERLGAATARTQPSASRPPAGRRRYQYEPTPRRG